MKIWALLYFLSFPCNTFRQFRYKGEESSLRSYKTPFFTYICNN